MTRSDRTGSFTCHVRYQRGAGAALSAAEIERLCHFATERGESWGTQICSFLGLNPARAVTVTLKSGVFLSMTRGTDIVVGVSAGAVSAALAHELVHGIVGHSTSPMYSEGLAVHVDSQLRLAGGVWPFFDLAPHRWVQIFAEDGTFVPLATVMATRRVRPSNEEGISGAARFYLEAASFVGFAIDLLGLEAFWPYFQSGKPLVAPDGGSLEGAWLAQLGGTVTEHERRQRDAAAARVAHDGRHGLAASTPDVGAGLR